MTFDGNWIDCVSAVVAVFFMLAQKRRKEIDKWTDRRLASYIATGIGLFPVLILALSIVSTDLLHELLKASRVTLFIAGTFALLAMLEDT